MGRPRRPPIPSAATGRRTPGYLPLGTEPRQSIEHNHCDDQEDG